MTQTISDLIHNIDNEKEVERNIKELLIKLGALKNGHFILSSGLHSPQYVQCALLFEYPDIANSVCSALVKKFNNFNKNLKCDVVVSPALGGMICGYEFSRCVGARNIFCERNAERIFEFRRGFKIDNGSNVVVVEDVVTTGGSVAEVIRCVKEFNGNIVGVCSVIDRTSKINSNAIGYNLISLLKLDIEIYNEDNLPDHLKLIDPIRPGSKFNKIKS